VSRFYPLEVTALRRETRDAVVITLSPRPEDRGHFGFVPGQYLTLRHVIDGEEVRRCYSICSGPGEPLQIAVKRVAGGVFSTFANEALAPGMTLEAMPPEGRFTVPIEAETPRHYAAIAAGSGITPVLAILKAAMARSPRSAFTLVYANRELSTIMFREELEALKNTHLERFSLLHVLSAGHQEIPLLSGRLDEAKLADLFRLWIDPASVDFLLLCGPEGLMLTAAASARAHGIEENRIKFELFASGQPGRLRPVPKPSAGVGAGRSGMHEAEIILDGVSHRLTLRGEETSLLDAALAAGVDAPYACKAGVCSTCRGRVLEGEVEMVANHALEDYEVRQGYVLTCQSHPRSARVVVSYDQ
jgi:ring-1,2-phenylacetyl-CoA epoxidase subunit PaaE